MGFVINLKAETGLVDRSENTTRFYKDIKNYKPFDKDEEIEWFTKLKEAKENMKRLEKSLDRESYVKACRDYEKVREFIILSNQRLIIAAAKNYSTTDTLTDYIDEINFGLIEAIDKYDVSKGVKFASYAMWYIIRAINTYKYGDAEMVQKSNLYKTFHVMSKAKNKFMQENEREPSTDELLEILNSVYGKDIKDKNDLLDLNYASIDVDASDDDDNYSGGDIVNYNRASASYNDYEKTETNEFNSKLISSLLTVLSPREQQIIKMRFGLYEDNGLHREYELNEIAEILGLTSERVRQLELGAMKTLREEYEKRLSEL